MALSLSAALHQKAKQAVRKAMDAMNLQDEQEIRLTPPADPSMGDLGMACHSFARILRKNPKLIAE